jgi:hypothetical protein
MRSRTLWSALERRSVKCRAHHTLPSPLSTAKPASGPSTGFQPKTRCHRATTSGAFADTRCQRIAVQQDNRRRRQSQWAPGASPPHRRPWRRHEQPRDQRVQTEAPCHSRHSLCDCLPWRRRLQANDLVRAAGLEPARPCGLRILSPVCLPIPSRPHGAVGHSIATL